MGVMIALCTKFNRFFYGAHLLLPTTRNPLSKSALLTFFFFTYRREQVSENKICHHTKYNSFTLNSINATFISEVGTDATLVLIITGTTDYEYRVECTAHIL